MEQNNNDRRELYRQRLYKTPYIELKRTHLYGRRLKRFGDTVVKFQMKYHVAKNGFYYGGLSGAALGFVFGIIPAIRHQQPTILIASMLISGSMFFCIGGFGSMLHSG